MKDRQDVRDQLCHGASRGQHYRPGSEILLQCLWQCLWQCTVAVCLAFTLPGQVRFQRESLGCGVQVTLERAQWVEDGTLLESDSSSKVGSGNDMECCVF